MAATNDRRRSWVAVFGGLASFLILGASGLAALRLWPDYALAEPTKAYTFRMLIARLTLAVICSAIAGAVATRMSKTGTGAAWWVGVILLVGSLPSHLVIVWADYPAWYHAAYLLPLIPVTGLSGTLVSAVQSRRGPR